MARIEEMAIRNNRTPTQVLEEIQKNDALDQVRTDVLEQKVRKWLTDNARISDETDGGDAGSEAANEEEK